MDENKYDVIDSLYKDYIFSEKKTIDNIKVYTIENETGIGEMKIYNLMEGIQLTYNTLHLETTYQDIKLKSGILQIDHCLEGSYEIKLKNHEYALLGKGELSIFDVGSAAFEDSRVPMKKYKGVSILIDVELAQKTIEKHFSFLTIDILSIRKRFCEKRGFSIINPKHEVNNIVKDLYKVDERIQVPYLIIKVLEILLFLSIVEDKDIDKLHSFSKPVYDATKECYKDLVKNPFDKYSISDLAKKYAISESSLKRCFVHIAGSSIGDFKRGLILEASADLLLEQSELSIGEVSHIAGYKNQSKFSSAFKSYYGVSPNQYRKRGYTLTHLEQKKVE